MNYDYTEIVPYLLHWYDRNARILAWRENPKPYYVWVSEIMLQQTRVEAVKGYFDRFITALPGIVIQLVVLPHVVTILMKARIIPTRYRKPAATQSNP